MKSLDGQVLLYNGDNREVLRGLADNSVDSFCTDPPYALVSIVKRFGGAGAAECKVPEGGTGAYARASKGFMGKTWDTGDTVHAVDFWAEVFRVLKPGGHVVAFNGTRTQHRMVCAIEDAGFEIRDMLAWLYGTGFPKSHDVSKGIDKLDAVDARRERQLKFTEWVRSTGLTTSKIDEITGTNMGGHYTTKASQPAVATRDLFELLRPHFSCEVPQWVEEMVDERTVESENYKARPITQVEKSEARMGESISFDQRSSRERERRDIPHTPAAIEWQGWGTALKPALEPICLARKPLGEKTVAANVLAWGTGALNIDGCRVGTEQRTYDLKGGENLNKISREGANDNADAKGLGTYGVGAKQVNIGKATVTGRWPANVITDGSEEVVGMFPDSKGQQGDLNATGKVRPAKTCFGNMAAPLPAKARNNSGSAARFFYSAKANKKDRADSKHPTVKPVSLMRWLARLVTPPGGTLVDPFAGSGTTGEAAYLEGFRAILIEREEEYVADITRRLAGLEPANDNTAATCAPAVQVAA